jgi:hypothetical protein
MESVCAGNNVKVLIKIKIPKKYARFGKNQKSEHLFKIGLFIVIF